MSQLVRVRLSHGLLEKVPLCAPRKRIWEVRRKSVELTIDGGQTDRRPPPTEWVKAGATTRATVCLPAMAADLTPCVFCGTPRPLDVPRCPTCKRGWIDSHVVTSTTRPSSGQDPEPAPASPTPTGTDDSADAPVAATAVPVATAAASTVPEAPAEPSPAEHEDEDEDDPPAGQGEPAMDADAAEVEAPPAVAAAGATAATVPEAPAEPSPAEHEDEDEDDPRPAKANRRWTQMPPKWRHHRRWLPQLQPPRPSPRLPPSLRLPSTKTRTRTTPRPAKANRRWTQMPRKCNNRRRRLLLRLLLLRRRRRPDPRHAPATSARRTTDPATGPPTTGRRASGRSPRPHPPIRSTTPRFTSKAASMILRPHPAGVALGSGCSSPAWSPY